jgi:hypothetical protein
MRQAIPILSPKILPERIATVSSAMENKNRTPRPLLAEGLPVLFSLGHIQGTATTDPLSWACPGGHAAAR